MVGEQLRLPHVDESNMSEATTATKKPRLTLKAKKSAVNDMMEQVKDGWEPNEETWRLLDWLNHDIRAAEAK